MNIVERYIYEKKQFRQNLKDTIDYLGNNAAEDLDFPQILEWIQEKSYVAYHAIGMERADFSILITICYNGSKKSRKHHLLSLLERLIKDADHEVKSMQGTIEDVEYSYPHSKQYMMELIDQTAKDFGQYYDKLMDIADRLKRTNTDQDGYEPMLTSLQQLNQSKNRSIRDSNKEGIHSLTLTMGINSQSPNLQSNVIHFLKQLAGFARESADKQRNAYNLLYFCFYDDRREKLRIQLYESNDPINEMPKFMKENKMI